MVIETTLYQNRAGVFFTVDDVERRCRDRNNEWTTRQSYESDVIGDAEAAREYC